MRCVCCDSNDWENVDQFRIKPSGMSICKNCGFVSYPAKWKTEEEIKQHYRKDYRTPPTINNFYTGQRKVYFHERFLSDLIQEWNKNGKRPVICEIGAAFGMALHWLKNATKAKETYGTELTVSYRRNAYHEFGLDLTEDFDASKKYDLIMSYKVAEHQLDIDQHLRKYAECLTEDGFLYISVPIWFKAMTNFGMGGFDLEYYYDPNHINTWTRDLFEGLLKKAGLEIVKQDHMIYDSTYLCKRNDALMSEPMAKENPADIKDRMDKIKQAYFAFAENRLEDAIKLWPNFPTAHINRAEMSRKEAFERGWPWIKEHIIDFGFKSCPESAEMFVLACDFAMRANQFNEAIKYAEDGLKAKPENPSAYIQLINIMRELAIKAKDADEKAHYFEQARNIARHLRSVSTQSMGEAISYSYLFNAHLPTPTELAGQ